MAEALGERAGALAGDIHKAGISGNLIEQGEKALRFREKAAVQIGFKLQQSIVECGVKWSRRVPAGAPALQKSAGAGPRHDSRSN